MIPLKGVLTLFHEYFPEARISLVLEILEYTEFNKENWNKKRKHLMDHNIRTVLDDFGTGNNTDISVVDTYDPIMIKLDRKLVSGIDTNKELQDKVVGFIKHRTCKEERSTYTNWNGN